LSARQCDFKNAASNAFKGLRVFGHAAELNELQFVTDQFLRTCWKCLDVPARISKPDNPPHHTCLAFAKDHSQFYMKFQYIHKVELPRTLQPLY